jgi:hypothetical protein
LYLVSKQDGWKRSRKNFRVPPDRPFEFPAHSRLSAKENRKENRWKRFSFENDFPWLTQTPI